MNLEVFKIKLIEQQIYEELKDSFFPGINYIKEKYQGSNINISQVYRKIVNYQIKKYGESRTSKKYWALYNKKKKRSNYEFKKVNIESN